MFNPENLLGPRASLVEHLPQHLLPQVHLLRAISRSTAIFERAEVSESGGTIRFTQTGTAGPS